MDSAEQGLLPSIFSGRDNGALTAIIAFVFLIGLRTVSQSVAPNNAPSLTNARTPAEKLLAAQQLTEVNDLEGLALQNLAAAGDAKVREQAMDAMERLNVDVNLQLLHRLDLSASKLPLHPVFQHRVKPAVAAKWLETIDLVKMSDHDFAITRSILSNFTKDSIVGQALVAAYVKNLRKPRGATIRERCLAHLSQFQRSSLGTLHHLFNCLTDDEWRTRIIELCAGQFSAEMLLNLRSQLDEQTLSAKIATKVREVSLNNGPEESQLKTLKYLVENTSIFRTYKNKGLPLASLRTAAKAAKSAMASLSPHPKVKPLVNALRLLTLVTASQNASEVVNADLSRTWIAQLQTISTSLDRKIWEKSAFDIADCIASLDQLKISRSWIQDESPRLRFLSIVPLEQSADDESKALLLALCKDAHPRVQLQAAAALTRAGDPKGLLELLKLTKSPVKIVAEAAQICIDFAVGRETSYDVEKVVAGHLKANKTLPIVSRDATNAPHPRKFVP